MTRIGLIIELLQMDDFIGESKNIDIAKGIDKLPLTVKEKRKQVKRLKGWQ